MFNRDYYKELYNPTVKELIDVLIKLPMNAHVQCDCDEYVHIHVEDDQSVVDIDSSALDELYQQ